MFQICKMGVGGLAIIPAREDVKYIVEHVQLHDHHYHVAENYDAGTLHHFHVCRNDNKMG